MKARIAAWVKWWREAWSIDEARRLLAMMGVWIVVLGVGIAMSAYREHKRDAQHLSLNCACRCDP